MKNFFQHIRSYIFRGLLAIIPIFLSYLAIKLLYVLIDKRVMALLDQFIEIRHIPGMGILLVLVCLYLIGMIVSNIVGKQLFRFIDGIGHRIPIIQTIYQVGKQVSESLSVAGDKQSFNKVLLVNWNGNGIWAIVFVAGDIIDQRSGEKMYRVFMPHVPNPATGFVFLVKESQTMDPGWTVEEAIKMVISGAIVSPAEIKKPA
ncbi:MAG: DUF502 domain-containing protein [Candidatus Omnitrophica bacterium]|nr:DUF502 domain-containing protein [Candidatus Omnitrophota bacterium]